MWNNVLAFLRLLKSDRKGIASLEWAVLAAFILLGLIAAMPALVSAIAAVFLKIQTALGVAPL